jgi:uncharacterized protein DUF6281
MHPESRAPRVVVPTIVLTCSAMLAACEQEGDCGARIRFEGQLFATHGDLNQGAPVGSMLGTGDIVDCGGLDDAPAVDTVPVYAVDGVDSEIAVATNDGEWRGIYVSEGTPPSSWPAPLRKAWHQSDEASAQ